MGIFRQWLSSWGRVSAMDYSEWRLREAIERALYEVEAEMHAVGEQSAIGVRAAAALRHYRRHVIAILEEDWRVYSLGRSPEWRSVGADSDRPGGPPRRQRS